MSLQSAHARVVVVEWRKRELTAEPRSSGGSRSCHRAAQAFPWQGFCWDTLSPGGNHRSNPITLNLNSPQPMPLGGWPAGWWWEPRAASGGVLQGGSSSTHCGHLGVTSMSATCTRSLSQAGDASEGGTLPRDHMPPHGSHRKGTPFFPCSTLLPALPRPPRPTRQSLDRGGAGWLLLGCGSCREGQGEAQPDLLAQNSQASPQVAWPQGSGGLSCRLSASPRQSCQTRRGAPTHSGQVAGRARAVFPCQTLPGQGPSPVPPSRAALAVLSTLGGLQNVLSSCHT